MGTDVTGTRAWDIYRDRFPLREPGHLGTVEAASYAEARAIASKLHGLRIIVCLRTERAK